MQLSLLDILCVQDVLTHSKTVLRLRRHEEFNVVYKMDGWMYLMKMSKISLRKMSPLSGLQMQAGASRPAHFATECISEEPH